MKSVYRVLCGAAAICIGLGLLLGIIGTALGARPADLSLSVTQLPALRFITTSPSYWGRDVVDAIWGRDTVEASYPADSVRRLDFDLEALEVTISPGEEFSVQAKNVNAKRFTTKLEGDTWVIDCDNRVSRHGWGNDRWGRRTPEVTITLPKGWLAEEVVLELGMGNLTLDGLAAKESCIDIGMGTAEFTGFASRDCDITVGMGTLILEGNLTGKGSITCGMGTAELRLSGKAADYGCTASAGMGSVTFAGQETGGLAGSMTLGSASGENWFDIECGMGTVEVYFDR